MFWRQKHSKFSPPAAHSLSVPSGYWVADTSLVFTYLKKKTEWRRNGRLEAPWCSYLSPIRARDLKLMYPCTGCPLTSFGARRYNTFPVGLPLRNAVSPSCRVPRVRGGISYRNAPIRKIMKKNPKNQNFEFFVFCLYLVPMMSETCFKVSRHAKLKYYAKNSFSMFRHPKRFPWHHRN